MSTTFVAIYRGQTVAEAKLIAVSADPLLVAEVSSKMLEKSDGSKDQVITALEGGRRSALNLILQEAKSENDDC